MVSLPVLEAENLKISGGLAIKHGFFTRQGGVSKDLYRSLNVGLGSDDDPTHIAQNRSRIAAHFAVDDKRLVTVHQCHSSDVIHVVAPLMGKRPRADGLVSKVPGLVLGVVTADCAPVLFVDGINGVIGAAHAGWHGSYGGILENTVTAMEAIGAKVENIMAALGPCIGLENYQVGEAFFAHFLKQSPDNERYFTPSVQKNHYLFDLGGYNIDRLARRGVACERLRHCTYEDETRFYSYRRMTHAHQSDYGRQLSAVIIR